VRRVNHVLKPLSRQDYFSGLLEPWQVVSRSTDKTEEFVKFEAEAFYKTY
jgi:hypothetical protein